MTDKVHNSPKWLKVADRPGGSSASGGKDIMTAVKLIDPHLKFHANEAKSCVLEASC